MSVVAEETFCIGEYPEYFPVLYAAISFFLCEMKKIRTKPLKEVDEIIGELFNINISYASDFRKLLFPNSKCKEKDNLRDKCFNQYKISHFRYDLMVSECKIKNIHLFNEMRDGMLLLSTYALPVSEILNGMGKYEIHADFKREMKSWINKIDEIMHDNSNLKVAIYMYLHQFRKNELVWWLLATLSSIEIEKVKKWIHVFSNISSEKSILEVAEITEKWCFLLDFKNKLPRLNAANLKNVYDNITGYDLECAYSHIDYFKQFSCTPLRQDDIYLTYLIVTTLNQHHQEMLLEQIAAESKATLPTKYCPVDEVEIDWPTQTAW